MAKIIQGTITEKKTNNPVSGLTVKLYNYKSRNELETVFTGEDGKYTVTKGLDELRDDNFFLNIYLNEFQISNNERSSFSLNTEITTKNYQISLPKKVHGEIVKQDGSSPDDTYDIKILEKTFGKKSPIANAIAKSNEKGLYEIYYYNNSAKNNIIVNLYRTGLNKVINSSDLIINADDEIKINFLIEEGKYLGPTKLSFYDKLDITLDPLIGKNNLFLTTINSQDVKILAEQEGLDEKTIKHFIRAKQVVGAYKGIEKSQVENFRKIVFSLLQQGNNINFASLLLKDDVILEKSLRSALENNTVAILKGGQKSKDYKQLISDLRSIVIDNLTEFNSKETQKNELVLYDILEDIIKQSDRKIFLEKYLNNKKNDKAFWENLKDNKILSVSEISMTKYKLDLALFTKYNFIIFDVLKKVGSMNQLAKQNINWLDETKKNTDVDNFPSDIEGNDLATKQQNFANYLSTQITKQYPSETIISKAKKGDFGQILAKLFSNNTDISLFKGKIDTSKLIFDDFVKEEEIKEAKNEIKAFQRVAVLLPKYEKINSLDFLWNKKRIKSAHDIIKIEIKKFVEFATANDKISIKAAKYIYTKAQKRHNKALLTFTNFRDKLNPVSSNVFNKLEITGNGRAKSEDSANLEKLFNTFDYCESFHCSSTLGASAYLADNLMFLQKIKIEGSSNTFYDKLIERRPDIAKINLNCKNTDTNIPYIDIVNEVLEQAVAGEIINKEFQTEWESDEINANPEHIIQAAYNMLKDAKNPVSLPFNYFYEEAKMYLEHLGVNFYDLIEKFPYNNNNDNKNLDIATDYLGLTTQERKIITGEYDFKKLFDEKKIIFKDRDNDEGKVLVLELLRQTGIEYEELIKLLDTDYINNDNDKKIIYVNECSLNEAYINFTYDVKYCDLDKLLRFKRLLDKLKWAPSELDRIITYLSQDKNYSSVVFDDDFILKLATIKRVQDETNASPQEVLSWWNTKINTKLYVNEDSSLYDDEFLDKSVIGDNQRSNDTTKQITVNNLTLNDDRTEIKLLTEKNNANAKLKDYIPDLIAGMNISDDDVNKILTKDSDFKDSTEDVKLNLENLSKVYRKANFARKMDIGVKDYYGISRMLPHKIGEKPEPKENTPEYTVKFIDFYKTLQKSGFTVNDLKYLFEHDTSVESDIIPVKENVNLFINSLIKKISSNYDKINANFKEIKELQSADVNATNADKRDIHIKKKEKELEEKQDKLLNAIVDFNLKNKIAKEEWYLSADNKKIISQLVKGENTNSDLTDAFKNSKQIFKDTEQAQDFLIDKSNSNLKKALYVMLSASHTLLENEIIQEISTHFKLDAEITTDLLYKYISENKKPIIDVLTKNKIDNFIISPVNIDNKTIETIYYRIHKASIFISKFALTKDMLSGIDKGIDKKQKDWLNIFNLPFEVTVVDPQQYSKWYKLFKLIEYNYTLFNDEITIFDYFNKLITEDTKKIDEKDIETLCNITNWDEEHTRFLIEKFEETENNNKPYDYRDIIWLEKLNEAHKILITTGVSPSDIIGWINNKDVDLFYANRIRLDVKSKYTHEQWKNIAPEMMNKFREKRRDALSNYLIFKGFGSNTFEDKNELYDFFLLDTEQSSCTKTSRIVLAHSVLQLFMLRVYLNLEGTGDNKLKLPKPFAKEWEWRKKYRVWEANRKVFLYPENWIEPELRDVKSEFFTELENELKHVDITDETSENAYRTYLEKLNDVSKLEIAQHFYDEKNKILYVFAHTYEQPHKYYFRTRDEFGEWTPWERVNIEIEGENMVPVIFRNRLFIFWITRIPNVDINEDDLKIDNNKGVISGKQPRKTVEIKIAWSEYKNKKWAAKRLFNKSVIRSVDDIGNINITLSAVTTKDNSEIFIYLIPNTLNFNDYFHETNAQKTLKLDSLKTKINNYIDTYSTQGGNNNGRPSAQANDWFDNEDPFNQGSEYTPPGENPPPPPTFEIAKFDLYTIREDLLNDNITYIVTGASLYFGNSSIFNSSNGTSRHTLLTVLKKLKVLVKNEKDKNDGIHLDFEINKVRTYYFRFNPNSDVFGTDSKIEYLINNIDRGIKKDNKILLNNSVSFELNYLGKPFVYNDEESELGLVAWDDDTKQNKTLLNNNSSRDSVSPRRITLPHQYQYFKSQTGAFLEDDKRVFFIEPKLTPAYEIAYNNNNQQSTNKNTAFYSKNEEITYKHTNALYPILKNSLPQVESSINFDKSAKVSYSKVNSEVYFGLGSNLNSKDTKSRFIEKTTVLAPVILPHYKFYTFYHPYTDFFIGQINKYRIEGLLAPKNPDAKELVHQRINTDFFEEKYNPANSILNPYPVENIDFEYKGAYSIYNWELFFHAPLLIADKLFKNRQFKEAQKWFHYIFDPTESEGNAPDRFWRIKPFADYNDSLKIEDLILEINNHNPEAEAQIEKWAKNPFKPHLIARMRHVAYMKNVLMKYLDNLIAWGDTLFAKDSIEYINEATQIYILAAKILGRRPVKIKRDGKKEELNFSEMENSDLFGNLIVQLEDNIYDEEEIVEEAVQENVNTQIAKAAQAISEPVSLPTITPNELGSLTTVLYFSVPENKKMLAYWETVADRLFKIRHCMNISGVERQLALFEAPIDPAMLVKAAANGISIGDALNNMEGGTPIYRFRYMMQKAIEFTSDVKSLGQSLLSALEKEDAEKLSIIRAGHEISVLDAVTYIKTQNIKEAKENIKALEVSKNNIFSRQLFYQNRNPRIEQEKVHLSNLNKSHQLQQTVQDLEALATFLSIIPQFNIGVDGCGGSPQALFALGGIQFSTFARGASIIKSKKASTYQHQATIASIKGGYDRRQEEWNFQRDSAKREILQIEKQIISSQIRLAVAEKDLKNHELQIENSKEAKEFMESKYTNAELYNWMSGEISNLHFSAYQLAFEMAKKTEKALQFELGKTTTDFVKFNNWDSMRKGLMAGDKLQNQLRQMETAYIEQNKREYEITKQISLALLNPNALMELRIKGKCDFKVPEIIYDMDFPGQYFRRVKSVSITIPAVTGPYTGVNCKLTLLNNRLRKSTENSDYYEEDYNNDDRFAYDNISKSVATSSGRNDAGMFEVNFNDERYLPFEGKGAIGTWQLELPDEFRQFDYDTITDVILTINYTAREGGIKNQVETYLSNLANLAVANAPLSRIISLKSEFNDSYNELLTDLTNGTKLEISKKHIPYFFKNKTVTVQKVHLIVKVSATCFISINNEVAVRLIANEPVNGFYYADITLFTKKAINYDGEAGNNWTFKLSDLTEDDFEDIILILEYKVENPS